MTLQIKTFSLLFCKICFISFLAFFDFFTLPHTIGAAFSVYSVKKINTLWPRTTAKLYQISESTAQ